MAIFGGLLALVIFWHLGNPAIAASSDFWPLGLWDEGNSSLGAAGDNESGAAEAPADESLASLAGQDDQTVQAAGSATVLDLPPGVAEKLNPGSFALEASILAGILNTVTPNAASEGWHWPVATNSPVSSGFGETRVVADGAPPWTHAGTDFPGPQGAPVFAANTGTVVLAQELPVRGNAVVIDHGDGIYTLYGHLSSIAVAPGEKVSPGQKIGGVGSTGVSTGPHLHWELIVNGRNVDGFVRLPAS